MFIEVCMNWGDSSNVEIEKKEIIEGQTLRVKIMAGSWQVKVLNFKISQNLNL